MSPETGPAARNLLVEAVNARRMTRYYQAQLLEQLAEYARATEDDEFASLNVATLLHMAEPDARTRLAFARVLTERLPRTLECLRAGRIDETKAKLIADDVTTLSDEHATQVEGLVLARAPDQTVGQLRAALAKAVQAVGAQRR